jgi:twitching motility protein PilI
MNAEAQPGSGSKLGFIAGGRHWLTELGQVNEVVTTARITPVPWAKPWFIGVAGVRGVIHGCTDLAAFFGIRPPSIADEMRLLLVHPRFGINAGLVIERAVGLRNLQAMAQHPRAASDPDWVLAHWQDGDGQDWTEISLEQLVVSPAFQQAGSETL